MNELHAILHDSKWINATTANRANSQHQDFSGIAKVSHKKELKNLIVIKIDWMIS